MSIGREIRIDRHAYDRYCERVAPIGWQELERLVLEQIKDGCRQKDGYVQIGDVWWRGKVTPQEVVLHTCYGVTHIDIPEAVRWARRLRDRIALGGER